MPESTGEEGEGEREEGRKGGGEGREKKEGREEGEGRREGIKGGKPMKHVLKVAIMFKTEGQFKYLPLVKLNTVYPAFY